MKISILATTPLLEHELLSRNCLFTDGLACILYHLKTKEMVVKNSSKSWPLPFAREAVYLLGRPPASALNVLTSVGKAMVPRGSVDNDSRKWEENMKTRNNVK